MNILKALNVDLDFSAKRLKNRYIDIFYKYVNLVLFKVRYEKEFELTVYNIDNLFLGFFVYKNDKSLIIVLSNNEGDSLIEITYDYPKIQNDTEIDNEEIESIINTIMKIINEY